MSSFFDSYYIIYIFVCMSPYRNVLRNSKNTSAKFHIHRVSRMRKYISLRSYESSVLQLAGLRVVGGRLALYSCSQLSAAQLCMLLACIYNLYKFFLNSSIIFCRTLVGSLPLANNVQHSASTQNHCRDKLIDSTVITFNG